MAPARGVSGLLIRRGLAQQYLNLYDLYQIYRIDHLYQG
jgi:hypothetical protein